MILASVDALFMPERYDVILAAGILMKVIELLLNYSQMGIIELLEN